MTEAMSIIEIRRKIETAKTQVRDKIAVCRVASRTLADAHKSYVKAEERLNKKNNQRNLNAFTVARDEYDIALKEYLMLYYMYDSLVTEVLDGYDTLAELESEKNAEKIKKEAEKYENQQFSVRVGFSNTLKNVVGLEDAINDFFAQMEEEESKEEKEREEESEVAEEEAKKPEEQRSGVYYPPQYAYPPQYPYPPYYPTMYDPYRQPQTPTGVEIAPVSLDITAMVEDAVTVALEKFKAVITERLETSTLGVQSKANTEPVKTEGLATELDNSKLCEVHEGVVEEERFVSERLVELITTLGNLTEEITRLSTACMEILNQQKDTAELQRKINEMQRTVARELAGVQATQKVINQEQVAVADEQIALVETQKATAENQKLLIQAQGDISEMQKTVSETQSAVESSMKGIVQAQKELISAQQSLLNGNAKNMELQKELTLRQAELTREQKEISSLHKQVARAVSKKKQTKKKDATVTETAEEITDAVSGNAEDVTDTESKD